MNNRLLCSNCGTLILGTDLARLCEECEKLELEREELI